MLEDIRYIQTMIKKESTEIDYIKLVIINKFKNKKISNLDKLLIELATDLNLFNELLKITQEELINEIINSKEKDIKDITINYLKKRGLINGF